MHISYKRFIGLLITCLTLVSCGETSKNTSIKDFETYRNTKWVCKENGFVIYVEGKGTPCEGIGYKNESDTPYFVNFSLPGTLTNSLCSIRNTLSDEIETHRIEKVIENNKWNGSIRIFDEHVDYVIVPTPLEEKDLNLGLFASTSFASKDGSIIFLFPSDPVITLNSYVWNCTYNQKKIKLSFGDNKTFKMIEGNNEAFGSYQASFDSATLTFTENSIFDGYEKLEMKYYFGSENMSFVIE